MHLLLVRHGETEWNVQRRIQGWTNSALTPLGEKQVSLLGKRLQYTPFAAAFVSDSVRTQQTGKAALSDRDIPMFPLVDLRETSWGNWEGKTAAEINAEEPELWSRFVKRGHEDPDADQADWEATTLVPGGETIKQASDRINGRITQIIRDYIETDHWILVVGHGGSLRFVITALLKLRPAAAKQFHLDNASLTHFSISPNRIVLKLLNDCSHWSESLTT
jgi:probable phosphoglycerate mutase